MDNLFEELISSSGIFADKTVLHPIYIPENLPHRKAQIKSLADILSAALKGETPSNILIYGKTGTGKTVTAKYVSNELKKMARKRGSNCSPLYINCEVFDTQYQVFAYLANLAIEFKKRVPMIGWSTALVYSEFKHGIDAEERRVIVILDEVDKLARKGDEVLYNLLRINSELNSARVSLIGISNDLTFTELLDPRVRSLLDEEEIIFPPYNAEQLRDILNERAGKAFNDSTLDDAVIPLCAAFAASEHGDARRALDLLCVSGEIAERSKSKKVCAEHVRLAARKKKGTIQTDFYGLVELLAKMYPQEDMFVCELLQNAHESILERKTLEKGSVAGSISIIADRATKTISFRDNGAGMTGQEIVDYLSTIDRFGTEELHQHLQEKNRLHVQKLIGQFGISILSAFTVAKRLVVETRSVDEDKNGLRWTFSPPSYDLEFIKKKEPGTTVTLYLKQEYLEMTNLLTLKETVRKYADFLPFPIYVNGRRPVNAIQAPWHRSYESEVERRNAYLVWVSDRFSDVPLEVIPMEMEVPHPVKGVLYIRTVIFHLSIWRG